MKIIDQNNFSQVRAYVGYDRLDTVAQTHLLNQLYDQLWLYHNFFQPVMRLHEKRFENGHVKRVYDSTQTPLDRLCHTKRLTPLKQAKLLALRRSLNPLQLRHNIQDLIDKISHCLARPPKAVPRTCTSPYFLRRLPSLGNIFN